MSVTLINPEEVQRLREENAVLRTQIAWLQNQLFGPGKSEKLDRAQLLLKLGELEKLAAAAQTVETVTYERTKGPRAPRTFPAETFAHLPVKETVVIEPAAVQADPSVYERIGEERTFEVDVTPPKLFKREIIRPKYRPPLGSCAGAARGASPRAAGRRRLRLGGTARLDHALEVRRSSAAVPA